MAAGRAGTVGGKAGLSAGGDVGDLKNKVLGPFQGHAQTVACSAMGMPASCIALNIQVRDMGSLCTIWQVGR